MRTVTVKVTFAPQFGPGTFVETKRMPAERYPDMAALLITHGYGSDYMHQTGEYVIGVSAVLHADGHASDQECIGSAHAGRPEERRLTRLPLLLAVVR